MKIRIFFAAATLALALSASADDQLRNVQTELKGQGFYYGDVNGQTTAETTSAIRRYQIRNGLEVTGSLNPETLNSLGLGSGRSKAAPPPPNAVPPASNPPAKSNTAPPANLRRDQSVEESARNFLRSEERKAQRNDYFNSAPAPQAPAPAPRDPVPAPRDASVVPPPAPLDAPSADFPVLFAGTPYANAPVSVQQQTLRRAQSVLASRGFYRDVVDGLPGPATEEALLTYQRSARLTLSGRLDLDTLNELRLLPDTREREGVRFGIEFRSPQHVFRGIWVDRR